MKNEPPTPFSRLNQWDDLRIYGSQLRHIINKQITLYNKEYDRIKKTKIAHSIGYLMQVQKSLITSDLEPRIEKLEQIAGITKKGVISN